MAWDAVEHFYWEPSHLGLASINQSRWGDDPELIQLPRSLIKNGGTIYTRAGTSKSNRLRVRSLEETLNHIFDITFAIAPDAVVGEILHRPLGIREEGPFQSIGREVSDRYGWGDANVTQQDGFFVSPTSAIGVELKLGATTSPIQVLKYLALIVLEELHSGRKEELGLLYVTPDDTSAAVFKQCGADEYGAMPALFWERIPPSKINRTVKKLLALYPSQFEAALDRLQIGQRSWRELAHSCIVRAGLSCRFSNDKTLSRLLEGFVEAVVEHAGTGVSEVPLPRPETMASVANRLAQEAAEMEGELRVHYLRLNRALTSRLDNIQEPNAGSVTHVISRFGIWAQYMAEAMETGSVSSADAILMLQHLSRAGDASLAKSQ